MSFLKTTGMALALTGIFTTSALASGSVQDAIPGDGGSFNFINGDIIVTDINRLKDFNYGHAAIVYNGKTAEAWPNGDGGLQNKPLSSWTSLSRYAVLRPKSGGSSAAIWAQSEVDRHSMNYLITANLYDKTNTYCSKFVWQSFYYGAGITLNSTGGMVTPQTLYNNTTQFTRVYNTIGTWQ
ncbi:hypothetical protein CIG75_04110 [Tumebacillus algifaecis]|uniref:Uncharacterized protein n=1 Tax=Tumebacillus algifaecis TaxID=1214604 RepID=A0A223CYL4_9BACL|nr:YiiX/YebB-like N1pC/P60 family cysteine hydrolase [Tumebacillus algifaecis]ASS74246.1 hypothetical protein CIG75_04110 [Tumebacillus algifaecis]